jgi:hypothetical protein
LLKLHLFRGEKERNWGNELELLKVSHEKSIDWMTQAQQDASELREWTKHAQQDSLELCEWMKHAQQDSLELREWMKHAQQDSLELREWMKHAQQESLELREMFDLSKQEHLSTSVQMAEEAKATRLQWDEQMDNVVAQLTELDGKNSTVSSDLRVQAQQRMDDLELIEKAMSTIQSQQLRLRGSVKTGIQV